MRPTRLRWPRSQHHEGGRGLGFRNGEDHAPEEEDTVIRSRLICASPVTGTVTPTTTVATAATSLRTSAASATARPAGAAAPSGATTAASPSGSSATAKTIAATVRPRFLMIFF